MAIKREFRYVAHELRTASDCMVLEGYAAVFNQESCDLGGFREIVAPGAFSRSLKDGADVRGTLNHDSNHVLGRTKSKTLTLSEDERGLKFRCELDNTQQAHRDLYASVKRGDIDQCSFAFFVDKRGQQWEMRKNDAGEEYPCRTLTDVDLLDVSVVTYPAYEATSVDTRSAKLFPDGEVAEIRSAIAQKAVKPQEQRARKDSFEEQLWAKREAIEKALLEKFGYTDEGYRKYYLLETYADHVIVCSYDMADGAWKEVDYLIPYTVDESGNYVFGEPKPVELDWVPSERSKQLAGEYRTAAKAFVEQRKAEQAAAAAAANPQPPASKKRAGCTCDCPECNDGDCENCSCDDCDCDGCECNERSANQPAETGDERSKPYSQEQVAQINDKLRNMRAAWAKETIA